ncbi:MAG: hypothetical protein IAF58_02490 [Leptolyngbya sp.]|nr:hypothetical protein [Candidatus Melainabacteria bacterium]
MRHYIFLYLTALCVLVSLITVFVMEEKAALVMAVGMCSFALHIVYYLIWGTKIEKDKD